MMALSIVDGVKLFGFLLIVVATFIATVEIPALDKEISSSNEDISKFKESRVVTALCMLNYGELFTRRRIELFEANQTILTGKDKKSVNELRTRALNQTIILARLWASLMGGDEANARSQDTDKKIQEIAADKNINIVEKLGKVEQIWKENQAAASKRLEIAHERYSTHKTIKKNLEKVRAGWAKGFAWLQIIGLILFSGAEIIDKFKS